MIMKNNRIYDPSTIEVDNQGKGTLNRYEYDLFDEEKDKIEKLVRVKRIQMPNKGEKWKIFCDNKPIFVIEGSKISKKEKEYLRTPEGFSFLILQCKNGIKSLNKLRIEIRKKIK